MTNTNNNGYYGTNGYTRTSNGYTRYPQNSKIHYPIQPRFPLLSGSGYPIPGGQRVKMGITHYPLPILPPPTAPVAIDTDIYEDIFRSKIQRNVNSAHEYKLCFGIKDPTITKSAIVEKKKLLLLRTNPNQINYIYKKATTNYCNHH